MGQRAVLAINGGACITCLVAGGVLTWTWQRVREIPRVELGDQLATTGEAALGSDEPQNVLIVGTDSADGLPEDDPIHIGRDAGVRTDTIMLLRIDPGTEQAALLSLPRDLYVPIAGTGGTARINAAIQGGPARLVATVTDALDLPVHHYVEVNFAGFRDLVEAIDGVPIYFPEPVRDRDSGLDVPEAGCRTLDPEQALAFARSRSYEVFRDGHWDVDGSGDLGRISRQQDFIRRALHRAFQRGARNPTVLADLVETGVRAITLDSTLTIGDLGEIALRFRTFDPESLVTYGLPVHDAVADGASVLRLDTTLAQPVLDVFRGADPHRIAPDNTVVDVRNGTASVGAAADGRRRAPRPRVRRSPRQRRRCRPGRRRRRRRRCRRADHRPLPPRRRGTSAAAGRRSGRRPRVRGGPLARRRRCPGGARCRLRRDRPGPADTAAEPGARVGRSRGAKRQHDADGGCQRAATVDHEHHDLRGGPGAATGGDPVLTGR